MLTSVVPILLVRDVSATAAFFEQRLGFQTDFLYGQPPFYAGMSRDGVALHLRYVAQPNFAALAAREPSLICTSFQVSDVVALYEELKERGAPLTQALVKQDWGGTDFHVGDLDGNVISFVSYG